MDNKVVVIGGGVTGMRAALKLSEMGIKSRIIEKDAWLGGKVKGYSRLFPDFRDGQAFIGQMTDSIRNNPDIKVYLEAQVSGVIKKDGEYNIKLRSGEEILSYAVIIAAGFDVFAAEKIPEYGFGIYPNVINSYELEKKLAGPSMILRPTDGEEAKSFAIVFCVGSRNKRLGNPYCSRICCSYSIKQAIEIKEKMPNANVVCFYMDIRTYGKNFEEMYQQARDMGVKFIRGRVADCSPVSDGRIQIRAENTLLGKPFQGIFDIVSLSVGMVPCNNAQELASLFDVTLAEDGFFKVTDEDVSQHITENQGVFIAGTVSGLKPIRDCLLDADSVAGYVLAYLKARGV